MDKIEDFKYLWTTERDKYYLEILDDLFCIMDINNMMLLVEDDELYVLIVEKMISNGVKVIERDINAKEVITVTPQKALQSFRVFQEKIM